MLKKIIVASVVIGATANATAQAPAAADSAAARLQATRLDKETLTLNVDSVGKLLEHSSAARQIEASKVAGAADRREKARTLHKSAQAALDEGDLEKAAQALAAARTAFFEAVRLAAPEEVHARKLENDYKARLDSVNALLVAYKRVAQEKGGKGVAETVVQIEKGIAEAAQLAKAARYKEGRAELDRAYLFAKAAISGLRSGDTLVRSLSFANKEEEYHYEIDRNNTHRMLIDVLLAEKRADGMVRDFMEKAGGLRTLAEAAASAKDYETGVKLLEESTAELVRAIRGAGLYIPG